MNQISGSSIVYLGQHFGQVHTLGGSVEEVRMLREVLQAGWVVVELDSGVIALWCEGSGYQTLTSAYNRLKQ